MYQLGIVSSEKFSERVITEFEKKGFMLNPLSEEQLFQKNHKFDGIFIEETENHSVSSICELILTVRRESDAFIWILSNKSTTIDRQVYFQLGVDNVFDIDYFPMEPLLLIKNSFSRQKMLQLKEQDIHSTRLQEKSSKKIELNIINHSLCISTDDDEIKEIDLTKLEYKAVKLLFSNPGQAFTYKEIYECLWNKPYKNQSYRVANIIFHIREKLENDSLDPNYIKTVRTKGYMINMNYAEV
ncbi:DNA-binding response regulator [Enterococcus sp. BWR-S5]|uniref:DNA-binding response regulator n=1 Tax=Enterococcus sp. BWR-S5 TaxID=2787714 RepID=UPI001922DD59|nr:winged helix-turn-helix domain-containing protein [Enterococcus sp. BWR-S5]MBL1226681.1 winged helix-turn-helix domain-containing protein [Enterococcus sp. BWR-S5]